MEVNYNRIYDEKIISPRDENKKELRYENYRCLCGSELFNVFSSGDYETSARCKSCGIEDIIHQG